MEYLHSKIKGHPSVQADLLSVQVENAVMVNVLLGCLRASFGNICLPLHSELYLDRYRGRQDIQWCGLNMKQSLKDHVIVWLHSTLFDWTNLSLHSDRIRNTTFAHNGLRQKFRNQRA